MTFTLRLRQEADTNLTTVWLIEGTGATSGLAYGVMQQDRAESLAKSMEALGVTVERTATSLRCEGEPRKR